MPVETPTTIHALLEFDSGAMVTLGASWDVWQHGHAPIELYGEEGTRLRARSEFLRRRRCATRKARKPVKKLPTWNHPFGVPNQKHSQGMMANYRTAGLADMALAIQSRAGRTAARWNSRCTPST